MSDTLIMTATDPSLDGRGRRISWIRWDSSFREAGLRVGEVLVGDHGERYTAEDVAEGRIIGGARESARLDRFGTKRGDPLTLLIEREGELVEIPGRLTGSTTYRDAAGRRCLGEGGPVQHEKDGYEYAWSAWYERFVDLAQQVLMGWDYTIGYDTRRLRAQLAEHEDRVAALERSYPSRFAARVREDYEAMLVMLAGERRELGEEDLAYRELGTIRAAKISAICDEAWERFLASFGEQLITEPFPAPKALEEDFRPLVGRTVLLPPVTSRDLFVETANSWYLLGRNQGIYLVNRRTPEIRGLYQASDSYIERVDPYLRERRITFVGVIEEQPAMVSAGGRTHAGIVVLPLGARVESSDDEGVRFFVDLRRDDSTCGPQAQVPFVGQDQLQSSNHARLEDGQGPAEVLAVMFESLEQADVDTWRACFADWTVRSHFQKSESYKYVDRTWRAMSDADAASIWDRSRQHLLEDVYGLEVASVSAPRLLYDASQQPAGRVDPTPRTVEEVRVTINHIGRFGDEFRTFAGGMLRRRWRLERLDEGPWRVTSAQTI
ncbi:MAG: hypothetical protein R6X02_32685 [Enhygromyxa sp.]